MGLGGNKNVGGMGSLGGGSGARSGTGGARTGVRQTTYKVNNRTMKKMTAADKRYAAADKKAGKISSQDTRKTLDHYTKTGELKPNYRKIPRSIKGEWKKNRATATRQLLKAMEVKKPGVSAVKPSLGKTAKPSAKTLKKGKK